MLTRKNIIKRDGGRCQYCGRKRGQMTVDHVVPKRYGGKTEWTNIVTCCYGCNRIKGGGTLKEAGLKLLKKPVKPDWVPFLMITIRVKSVPEAWRDYLYWNLELQDS